MPQTIVPNLYENYKTQSTILEPRDKLFKVITELLEGKKYAGYQCEELVIQNQDPQDTSVIFTISTKKEGNKIGQITFNANETTEVIKTSYSNEILEAVFQPLFSPNYYIPLKGSLRQQDLGFVKGVQTMFHQFYTSAKSLQFAAKIEEIHNLYEGIKQKHPHLNPIGDKKLLERDFFGQTQENEKTVTGQNLTEEEKIIAEINEIAQTAFFRTPVTNSGDPGSPEGIAMLNQRLNTLNILSEILEDYSSNGTLPNKEKINHLRLAVKTLDQPDNYAESKTQRIVSAIGMGIGIPAFIASIVFIVLMTTLPLIPLWLSIAAPVLFFGGGLMGGWSAMGFHFSFPQGVAKDLYFVADKMEAEFDKKFPEGSADSGLGRVGEQTRGMDLTPNQHQVEQNSYDQIFANPSTEQDPEATELRALLKSACKGFDEKEQKHLADGLNTLLYSKAGYKFDEIKAEITGSKGKTSQFEWLCTAFGVSNKIQEPTRAPKTT